LIVAALSGALLGFLGVYIVLRGMSYIGHGLSHSIFGGFAAVQLFAAQFYAIGAALWGIASALAINGVTRRTRIGADAAIGVITTASFALGVALFAKFGTSGPAFENALFGSILGISNAQIIGLSVVALLALIFVVTRYRALLFATFDPDVASVSGVNVPRIEALFMIVLSLSILATLTVIGVTLVAAMLVIPAVIARMLTDSFARMLLLSTAIGTGSGIIGMYASYFAGVPSGTMIVLVGAALFCIVLAITGGRGLRRSAGLDSHPSSALA
ncbi:MAG: metal ABC transporter permease, partial [Candidatus Nanopelagicales bacterium]|nr:metal ABC transporter permease [Candidatus Nanopelagicales bacterium]MCF8542901.1 metal ABC transporter permease [Candidatus Nanopelagicales bacterium]